VRINGSGMHSRTDFRTALQDVKAGDIVTIEVLRRTGDGWDTGIVRVRAR